MEAGTAVARVLYDDSCRVSEERNAPPTITTEGMARRTIGSVKKVENSVHELDVDKT